MHYSSLTLRRNTRFCARQAFALQYTSLLLIVLCFCLGSFLSRSISRKQLEIPTQVRPSKLVSFSIPELFVGSSDKINQDAAESLSHFVKNHDLNLRVVINSSAYQELAVAQSIAVYRYLLDLGARADAVEVMARNTSETEEGVVATITFPGESAS